MKWKRKWEMKGKLELSRGLQVRVYTPNTGESKNTKKEHEKPESEAGQRCSML